MLGAGPRAQKEGDDVMGQQCHHTKRIILQKYFIASLASYWSLSADAFLLCSLRVQHSIPLESTIKQDSFLNLKATAHFYEMKLHFIYIAGKIVLIDFGSDDLTMLCHRKFPKIPISCRFFQLENKITSI
jgi:hypothetical protein